MRTEIETLSSNPFVLCKYELEFPLPAYDFINSRLLFGLNNVRYFQKNQNELWYHEAEF